jgi:hypothetical protein
MGALTPIHFRSIDELGCRGAKQLAAGPGVCSAPGACGVLSHGPGHLCQGD